MNTFVKPKFLLRRWTQSCTLGDMFGETTFADKRPREYTAAHVRQLSRRGPGHQRSVMLTPGDKVRKFVRAERRRRDWSQDDLARAAGIKSRTTIQKLEAGNQLRDGTEAAVERALGVPVGTFDEIRAGADIPASHSVTLAHGAPTTGDPEFWEALRKLLADEPEMFNALFTLYLQLKEAQRQLAERSEPERNHSHG